MSVTELLAHAKSLGIQLHAVGDDIKARWPENAPPPVEFVAALKTRKIEILAVLSPDSCDWHEYFEERAAIREYDGGMSRSDAEAGALDDCMAHWRALNPLPAPSNDLCVHCGKAGPDTPVLARPHRPRPRA